MDFFPRYRQFWVYHGSMTLVVFILQMLLFAVKGDYFLLNSVGSLLWLPLFTLSALTFRYTYNRRGLHNMKMGLVIPFSLLLGAGIGICIAIVMLLILTPLFWEQLFSEAVLSLHQMSAMEMVGFFLINNGLIQSFLMCGWIFIYISSTANRRVLEGEVKNLKLENTLKEAKISQLSNQLNPHFLFNSINNIRFMIHESPDHADNMLTALSEILRYSLQSSAAYKVQLNEELNIVQLYVDIAKLQLEERLNFVLQCDDKLTGCFVPPMLLQLLVENAVKHGLDHIPAGGDLTIKISQKDKQLQLLVTNPKPEKPRESTGTGLGIENIKQRLSLLYQDDYQFEILDTNKDFTVKIELPMELKK